MQSEHTFPDIALISSKEYAQFLLYNTYTLCTIDHMHTGTVATCTVYLFTIYEHKSEIGDLV